MAQRTIELVEAAAQLRIAYHTAHRWALTGRLDAERRNGHWTVSQESVDRVVSERQTPQQEPE